MFKGFGGLMNGLMRSAAMRIDSRMKWVSALLLGAGLAASEVGALESAPGIIGKSDWLFYRYELTEPSHAAQTNVSIDLIGRLNRLLSARKIQLAVAMVPLKMRVYSEYLPDDIKMNSYMTGNYERMASALRAAKVNVVDLNTAFLNNPKRSDETPLFFRLDTHWTPVGAMLAAQTTKAALDNAPDLKAALDATTEEGFKMVVQGRKRPSKGRDLIGQLAKNELTFAPEMIAQVNVSRTQPPTYGLLGKPLPTGIALVGSSYSHDWTGFTDALRYVLQREVLSVSVGADQGSWVGIESYLRDDAFQTNAPKILIWEMPERDMRAPPDYPFRGERYVSNNEEWLMRVSAWIQPRCQPSAVVARISPMSLAANSNRLKPGEIASGVTKETDFVEVVFDKPLDRLDYVQAHVMAVGGNAMTVEGSGTGVAPRTFKLNLAGDDAPHLIKSPLSSGGNGFTKVRLFPGASRGFSLQGLEVCRQPEDLLL